MSSLRQLLQHHAQLLVLDACSPWVEASLWQGGETRPAGVARIEGEASVALPVAVARVLRETRADLRTLEATAFCDGPGSVLGIRLSAASLRAWRVAARVTQSCYSFHSLPLLAVSPEARGATVVADARRDSWHAARSASPHELLRLPGAELPAEPCVVSPAPFRRWSTPPPGVHLRELPWSVAALLAAAPDEPFFHPAPEPEAFLTEAPSYAVWTPRVHRAPAAASPGR